MTEEEWMACTDPQKMLEFLRGKATERKLPLFAVACARSAWDQITEEEWRAAIDKAERFADGLGTREELGAMNTKLFDQFSERGYAGIRTPAWALSLSTVLKRIDILHRMNAWRIGSVLVRSHQPVVLREIVGPLHFRPFPLNPTWLA
jgi:hypothetical protein